MNTRHFVRNRHIEFPRLPLSRYRFGQ